SVLFAGRLKTILADPSMWGRAGIALITYFVWGIYQEVMYRGILQTELTRRWGSLPGILVGNTLYTFGPLHLYHVSGAYPSPMIGKRLSHFRILEKVGEGGMGVVYRAEDETLRRVVALKVLPPDLVGNEKRRLRLLREARAAAAVSHANLATIYEIAEADGVVFIAMEYIEGPTLRRRIGGRPMEMKEALRIAAEVAEGR